VAKGELLGDQIGQAANKAIEVEIIQTCTPGTFLIGPPPFVLRSQTPAGRKSSRKIKSRTERV